jgi:hypothetical protein
VLLFCLTQLGPEMRNDIREALVGQRKQNENESESVINFVAASRSRFCFSSFSFCFCFFLMPKRRIFPLQNALQTRTKVQYFRLFAHKT